MLVLSAAVFLGASASVYAQASVLDKTFGTNGTVRDYFPTGDSLSDQVSSVAIQSDGKIVVAGTSLDETSAAFALARYDTNGSLDPTFGSGGFFRSTDDDWTASSMLVQPDGKIVLAGNADFTNTYDMGNVGFGLKRFNSNGSADNSFGTDGEAYVFIVSNPPGSDFANDAATSAGIQANGKLVVAGYYSENNGTYGIGFALARFKSNGTIDSTFGSGGVVRTYISNTDSSVDLAHAMAIQSDGKIIVAGTSYEPFNYNLLGVTEVALARYDTNGTLDNTFGTNGTVRTSLPGGGQDDEVLSVAIQSDGKILTGGYSITSTGPYLNLGSTQFAVARFNSNGSLDNTFGNSGVAMTYIAGGDSVDDQASAIALQLDRKVVLAGNTYSASGTGKYAFAVARFNSNGTLDNTFGTNGSALTVFPAGDSTDDEARAVAVQSNGKVVAAGFSFGNSNFYLLHTGWAFALARYLPSNVTGVEKLNSVPETFELYQNYPNPFNPSTTINYQLPMDSHVTLKVYDILGREVATLVNEKENAGNYSVKFDGSRLASGVYFYRLTAGNFMSTKKLLMLK